MRTLALRAHEKGLELACDVRYEATKALEQYDAVDARNRLAAGELERRWTEKLEEIEADDRTGTRCQIGSFGSGST